MHLHSLDVIIAATAAFVSGSNNGNGTASESRRPAGSSSAPPSPVAVNNRNSFKMVAVVRPSGGGGGQADEFATVRESDQDFIGLRRLLVLSTSSPLLPFPVATGSADAASASLDETPTADNGDKGDDPSVINNKLFALPVGGDSANSANDNVAHSSGTSQWDRFNGMLLKLLNNYVGQVRLSELALVHTSSDIGSIDSSTSRPVRASISGPDDGSGDAAADSDGKSAAATNANADSNPNPNQHLSLGPTSETRNLLTFACMSRDGNPLTNLTFDWTFGSIKLQPTSAAADELSDEDEEQSAAKYNSQVVYANKNNTVQIVFVRRFDSTTTGNLPFQVSLLTLNVILIERNNATDANSNSDSNSNSNPYAIDTGGSSSSSGKQRAAISLLLAQAYRKQQQQLLTGLGHNANNRSARQRDNYDSDPNHLLGNERRAVSAAATGYELSSSSGGGGNNRLRAPIIKNRYQSFYNSLRAASNDHTGQSSGSHWMDSPERTPNPSRRLRSKLAVAATSFVGFVDDGLNESNWIDHINRLLKCTVSNPIGTSDVSYVRINAEERLKQQRQLEQQLSNELDPHLNGQSSTTLYEYAKWKMPLLAHKSLLIISVLIGCALIVFVTFALLLGPHLRAIQSMADSKQSAAAVISGGTGNRTGRHLGGNTLRTARSGSSPDRKAPSGPKGARSSSRSLSGSSQKSSVLGLFGGSGAGKGTSRGSSSGASNGQASSDDELASSAARLNHLLDRAAATVQRSRSHLQATTAGGYESPRAHLRPMSSNNNDLDHDDCFNKPIRHNGTSSDNNTAKRLNLDSSLSSASASTLSSSASPPQQSLSKRPRTGSRQRRGAIVNRLLAGLKSRAWCKLKIDRIADFAGNSARTTASDATMTTRNRTHRPSQAQTTKDLVSNSTTDETTTATTTTSLEHTHNDLTTSLRQTTTQLANGFRTTGQSSGMRIQRRHQLVFDQVPQNLRHSYTGFISSRHQSHPHTHNSDGTGASIQYRPLDPSYYLYDHNGLATLDMDHRQQLMQSGPQMATPSNHRHYVTLGRQHQQPQPANALDEFMRRRGILDDASAALPEMTPDDTIGYMQRSMLTATANTMIGQQAEHFNNNDNLYDHQHAHQMLMQPQHRHQRPHHHGPLVYPRNLHQSSASAMSIDGDAIGMKSPPPPPPPLPVVASRQLAVGRYHPSTFQSGTFRANNDSMQNPYGLPVGRPAAYVDTIDSHLNRLSAGNIVGGPQSWGANAAQVMHSSATLESNYANTGLEHQITEPNAHLIRMQRKQSSEHIYDVNAYATPEQSPLRLNPTHSNNNNIDPTQQQQNQSLESERRRVSELIQTFNSKESNLQTMSDEC